MALVILSFIAPVASSADRPAASARYSPLRSGCEDRGNLRAFAHKAAPPCRALVEPVAPAEPPDDDPKAGVLAQAARVSPHA